MIYKSILRFLFYIAGLAGICFMTSFFASASSQNNPSSDDSHTTISISLSGAEQEWLNKNHLVRIRIGSFPPFMFSEGKIRGISIDYIEKIFKQHGIRYQYIPDRDLTWGKALENIKNHEVVDLLPAVNITPEREKYLVFTQNYLSYPWVIFTRTDVPFINGIEALKGKTVAVPEAYVMHSFLKDNYPEINLHVIRGERTVERCLKALASGVVDGYVGNLAVGSYLIAIKGYSNVKIAAPTPFGNHDQAMGIRDDWPELAGIINKSLAVMTQEEHADIRNKWMSVRYEYGIQTKDIVFWVMMAFGISILGFAIFFYWNQKLRREIDERQSVEAALAQSEKKFRAIFEQSPLGIALLSSKTGQFLQINQRYCDILAYSMEEMYKKDFKILTHPDDLQEDIDNMERLRNHQIASFFMEKRYLTKKGDIRWVALNVVPLWEAGEELKVHMAFVDDITERRKADEERIRLLSQLQQSQKMESVGTLASGVAHEINNPINGIMNYAQLIMDKSDADNPISAFAEEIIHETDRVAKIVKNLLAFARVETSGLSAERIVDIINAVMSLIQAVVRGEQIQIHVDVPDNLPKIHCRSQEIQQVMMNLITNARDALNEKYPAYHENKIMQISSSLVKKGEKQWIRTTVKDHGNGILRKHKERIFDPFFTTKSRAVGTGLGLSISYQIVQNHHGELSFESEPGQNTKFHVDLPVDEMTAPETNLSEADQQEIRNRQKECYVPG